MSSSVSSVGTTSTSFITGAGLKKWRPITLVGRCVAIAMFVTDSDDVVVDRIVFSPHVSSS